MLEIRCPTCGRTCEAPENLLGTQVRCARCGGLFQAHPSGPAAPQEPAPGKAEEPKAAPIKKGKPPTPSGKAEAPKGAPARAAAPPPAAPAGPAGPAAPPTGARPMPPWMGPRRPNRALILGLSIGGGALVLAGLIVIIVLVASGRGGLPGWADDYIPTNVARIRYCDFTAMRADSALDEDAVNRAAKAALPQVCRLEGKEVLQVLETSEEGRANRVVVIRTKDDVDARDAAPGGTGVEREKYGNKEYLKTTEWCASQTDSRTICFTLGREGCVRMMEDVIDRLAGKKDTVKIPPELRKVLDVVSGEREFSVSLRDDRAAPAEGYGTTTGSTYRALSVTLYKHQEDAKKTAADAKERHEKDTERIRRAIEDTTREADKRKMEAALEWDRSVTFEQSSGVYTRKTEVSLSSLRSILGLPKAYFDEVQAEVVRGRNLARGAGGAQGGAGRQDAGKQGGGQQGITEATPWW